MVTGDERTLGEIIGSHFFELIPMGVLGVDREGRILQTNRYASEMFGFEHGALEGLELEIVVPERLAIRHARLQRKYFADPKPRPMGNGLDLMARRRDGTEFPVEIALSPAEVSGEPVILCFVVDMSVRRRIEEENRLLVVELQRALDEIRRLGGLLPICASCKKIRDDAGRWWQVEEYIEDNSDAEFSHGICPDCAERLYPQYFKREN